MTPWSTFDTAFGPRTGDRIPLLLERLDAHEARVRARAYQDLEQALVRRQGGFGTPFLPASLALVPELVARVNDPATPPTDAARLLVLLGDLAVGTHTHHLSRGLPDGVVAGRSDLGPAAETRAAVGAAADVFLARLTHADVGVRAAAAFVLGWLPAQAATSVPALAARLTDERRPVVRAALALALGYLAAATDDRTPAAALRPLLPAPFPVGRCAALGLLLADPSDDLAVDALLAPIQQPVVKGIPWNRGALLQLGTWVLGGAVLRRGDLGSALALEARLPEGWRREAAPWVVAVAAGSDGWVRPAPLDPATLPDASLAELRARAAGLDDGRNPAVHQAFWRAGLFGATACTQRALGIAAQGPLDERVDGAPLWLWLHRVRRGEATVARWQELLRTVDALAALEDAAQGPFELYRTRPSATGYDVEPLLAVLEASASALGVGSDTLASRIAQRRADAANPAVLGPGAVPWP